MIDHPWETVQNTSPVYKSQHGRVCEFVINGKIVKKKNFFVSFVLERTVCMAESLLFAIAGSSMTKINKKRISEMTRAAITAGGGGDCQTCRGTGYTLDANYSQV
jgi:hypothetical protein